MNQMSVIRDYIRDQWVNFHRSLNEPMAREELLCGARLSFYEPGTTKPVHVFYDRDCSIPHPSPVIADSHGEFYPIYASDLSRPISMKLAKMSGETILCMDDARELFG